jgi:hypothetical protein
LLQANTSSSSSSSTLQKLVCGQSCRVAERQSRVQQSHEYGKQQQKQQGYYSDKLLQLMHVEDPMPSPEGNTQVHAQDGAAA